MQFTPEHRRSSTRQRNHFLPLVFCLPVPPQRWLPPVGAFTRTRVSQWNPVNLSPVHRLDTCSPFSDYRFLFAHYCFHRELRQFWNLREMRKPRRIAGIALFNISFGFAKKKKTNFCFLSTPQVRHSQCRCRVCFVDASLG